MIEWLNATGSSWWRFWLIFELQNSVFLLLVFGLLFFFRNGTAHFKKQMTVLGMIKTLLPPLIVLPAASRLLAPVPPIFGDSFSALQGAAPLGAGSSAAGGLSLKGMLFVLYLSGVFFILLSFSYQAWRFRRKARRAKALTADEFPLSVNIPVLVSAHLPGPLVCGLIRPKILLPEAFRTWPEDMQRSILRHELNHIRAGDLYLNVLKTVSFALHFFNPLHWLLLHRFELLTEMACDDRTVAQENLPPGCYNRFILKAAESIARPVLITKGWGFSRTFHQLKQRFSYQIKNQEVNIMQLSKTRRRAVYLFLLAMLLPLSWQCSKSDTPPEQSVTTVAPTNDRAAPDENGVYPFFAVDQKPKMIEKARPVYPDEARRAGEKGLVVVTVTIDENGKVVNAIPLTQPLPVVNADGKITGTRAPKRHPLLEPAAVEAALKCTFEPAKKDGKPVKVKMNIPFRFRLH